MFGDWYRRWMHASDRLPRVQLQLEPLEERRLPAAPPIFAVGADAGGGPQVNVYNRFGQLLVAFRAYAPSFTGGVRVAVGDVNGDGAMDIITAPGPGGGPDVRVFDGAHLNTAGPNSDIIREFFAYSPNFLGGVYVASGDVNRDGFADIITGAGAGGGPHVEVFNGLNLGLIYSFYAYSGTFGGGVRVASGDVNGDGFADIITGPGPGGGPVVRVFSGFSRGLIDDFFAYNPNFAGGVYVASGDVNRDGFADVITGQGEGGSSLVNVFSGANGSIIGSFFAFAPTFSGGVRVAASDLNLDGFSDVITGAGPGGTPTVRIFSGFDGSKIFDANIFPIAFNGGVFVGGA